MRSSSFKTYLDAELARELARTARAQGRSESAFIADAVRHSLAKGANAPLQAASSSQARRLNRIEVRLDALFRDQALLKESVLLFVRVWLEHNPPLDEALAESAAMSAEARFERFLDLVAQTMKDGGSFRPNSGSDAHEFENGYDVDDREALQ